MRRKRGERWVGVGVRRSVWVGREGGVVKGVLWKDGVGWGRGD